MKLRGELTEKQLELARCRNRRAVKKYRDKHIRLGLCVDCSEKAAEDSVFCTPHRLHRNLVNRLAYKCYLDAGLKHKRINGKWQWI
jgi:hypothetical protein